MKGSTNNTNRDFTITYKDHPTTLTGTLPITYCLFVDRRIPETLEAWKCRSVLAELRWTVAGHWHNHFCTLRTPGPSGSSRFDAEQTTAKIRNACIHDCYSKLHWLNTMNSLHLLLILNDRMYLEKVTTSEGWKHLRCLLVQMLLMLGSATIILKYNNKPCNPLLKYLRIQLSSFDMTQFSPTVDFDSSFLIFNTPSWQRVRSGWKTGHHKSNLPLTTGYNTVNSQHNQVKKVNQEPKSMFTFVTLPSKMSHTDTQSQYRMQRFSICRSKTLIFGFHQNRVPQTLFCSKTWLLMVKSDVLWQFQAF